MSEQHDAGQSEVDGPLQAGDRVVAARDLDTTQLLHIPQGTHGTVAEDRGSKLVVFFDQETAGANLDEEDLRKLADSRPPEE